ncbi:hypothetical protein SBOR_5882 [Sclerotinia borealis F-4128]|uniref:Uncharacterized protein n=1 Tax=Sclerotinia borealis (strain F-4128) TaxID=1432307 RepID=W9CGT2_SCLBF|nr:hypothetical protein SBOR_5882 [Sclerotinia borealis F-4128]
MSDRPKSPKAKYQTERIIRVDAMPPAYRSSTYVVQPALLPLNHCHGNLYLVQEREREPERAPGQEREGAREINRRPSCSDLFHSIDVMQRLGERFKVLNATFSHPSPPTPNANSGNNNSSPLLPPHNGNPGHGNTNAPPAQANDNPANAALAARIKELKKEKEIEKLNGELNGFRGDIKELQMKSEREEGRREGRMEGMGLGNNIMVAGHGRNFGDSWIDTNGELGHNFSQRRGQDRDRDAENTRRRIEALEQQRVREVGGELLLRRIDDRLEGRLDRMADAERQREIVVLRERERERERDMENERRIRMDRFEDRVEGRVDRFENRVDRMVEREFDRVGEGVRGGERERERERRELERYARPRIMRERERERDWEYGYENGSGYGGRRYRGYV